MDDRLEILLQFADEIRELRLQLESQKKDFTEALQKGYEEAYQMIMDERKLAENAREEAFISELQNMPECGHDPQTELD